MQVNSIKDFDERQMRIDRLEEIKKVGLDPYPSANKRTHTNKQVLGQFEELSDTSEVVFCVGRIRLLRRHGGATFANIEDASATLQIFFKKDVLQDEKYGFSKKLDVGDFIQVKGSVFKTRKEEITILVSDFTLLSKSLRPLPDKWHGLQNKEERYRKRYLDLIMNPEVKELFKKKARFIQAFRQYYLDRGFIEVNTPVLENIPGGAEATPFITHHNTLDIDLYLRISLELHLKRLIVGGYEKIFEIGPVFRNEGMSTQHLQEFTMLESYEAYRDYNHLMAFIPDLYRKVIQKVFGTLKIKYKDNLLDFERDWPKLDYCELVQKYADIDLSKFDNVEALKEKIKQNKINIAFDLHSGLGRVIDQLYKKTVRPNLIQPCLLVNHPLSISPLSKKHPKDKKRVERIQVLIEGAEVGNAFSELNDPLEQKERFIQQDKLRKAGDEEAQMMDEDFVEALEYGMPPTAGFGVGMERLFVICSNSESVRDVVFFPIMKVKTDPKTSGLGDVINAK